MTGHETPLFVFDTTRICCSGGLFSRPKSADGHCPGLAACSAAARNEIAADYVRKAGIPIDDLYAAVLDHPEYYLCGDGTHPTNPQGRKAEARDVAAYILKVLGK